MKVALLSNYAPDAQQSMLRFGELLGRGLRMRGVEVAVVRPRVWCRRGTGDGGAAAKWLGYLDKYVLAPRALRRSAAGADLVHIVDHSNALYAPPAADAGRWVATCHDLLAVRGALGEDTDCPASALGRRLQGAIVRGLARVAAIACDSTSTGADVERLIPAGRAQVRRVILLGLNQTFAPVPAEEARRRLAAVDGDAGRWRTPFLLHVGSNLARKNKRGVVRVLARAVAAGWAGRLVFAGAALPPEVLAEAAAAGVAERVSAVPAPDGPQLEALYSLAHALVFPSRCEGFGWPVIEAQACGCPVICSDRTSLPEVGGAAASVHTLDDESGMAAAVVRWSDAEARAATVAAGRMNVRRFSADRMVDDYLALYREVLAGGGKM